MTDPLEATPKLKPEDIFKVSDDMPAEDLAVITEYLSHFAPPQNAEGKMACVNCNAELDGFKHALGYGQAYRWLIIHGEAECTGCGWPARGMHYVKGTDGAEIFSVSNLFLPYHPSEVSDARATSPTGA
jgi:hypothetical protein